MGLSNLFKSKKGIVSLIAMVIEVLMGIQGLIDADTATMLVASTAAAHNLSQGIADHGQKKEC